MAPRKRMEEKASANEAADMVLHYLRTSLTPSPYGPRHVDQCLVFVILTASLGKQNRPYSAIDVSANLHNKVTKGVCVCV